MKLFTSATLKLAGWYLLILMTVSVSFSGIIFNIARSEVDTRLHGFQIAYGQADGARPFDPHEQMVKTEANLVASLVSLNLIVLVGGGVVAYLLARRTLEPIEAAHDAQSRFVANASHQLRTPLAVIKAESELVLSDSKATKASLRSTIESNLEEANRLNELATMLLELSRSECELGANTETFDAVDLVRQLVASRPGASRVSITAPEAVNLTSHRPAVREIIAILLDNAAKHSPDNSPITITITHAKNQLTTAITNRGAGITKNELPHIFERFYRGREQSDSYGLGLSLAWQLAKALGGQLSATSTPGKVTTFTISLPIR